MCNCQFTIKWWLHESKYKPFTTRCKPLVLFKSKVLHNTCIVWVSSYSICNHSNEMTCISMPRENGRVRVSCQKMFHPCFLAWKKNVNMWKYTRVKRSRKDLLKKFDVYFVQSANLKGQDLWPILQPDTRGQSRCFGFTEEERSCPPPVIYCDKVYISPYD